MKTKLVEVKIADGITVHCTPTDAKKLLKKTARAKASESARVKRVKRGKWMQADESYRKVEAAHKRKPDATNYEIAVSERVGLRTVARIRGGSLRKGYTITSTTTPL